MILVKFAWALEVFLSVEASVFALTFELAASFETSSLFTLSSETAFFPLTFKAASSVFWLVSETTGTGSFFTTRLEFLSVIFLTKGFVLTVKQLILTELALQSTVVKFYFDRRLQTDLVETFVAIAQNPGIVAGKSMFQTFANHLV